MIDEQHPSDPHPGRRGGEIEQAELALDEGVDRQRDRLGEDADQLVTHATGQVRHRVVQAVKR